jgi:ATP-dependent 26S proteasome regulatory subunit
MDGFGGDDNILIIGATNRADSLDKALTRAGRFDLKINISLPYFHSRVKLLEYFL